VTGVAKCGQVSFPSWLDIPQMMRITVTTCCVLARNARRMGIRE
jgi:hypothetical protein